MADGHNEGSSKIRGRRRRARPYLVLTAAVGAVALAATFGPAAFGSAVTVSDTAGAAPVPAAATAGF
jgi:hypothetical protein